MSPLFRASTEAKVVTAADRAYALLIGLIIFATGTYFEVQEYADHNSKHTSTVIVWAVVMVLGLLVAFRAYVFPVIQNIVLIAKDTNIPWIGGRRAGDLNADGTPKTPPDTDK